jgi:hypothetical protein
MPKRTDAQRLVIKAAFSKDISASHLTNTAAFSGIFIKPGTKDKYSQSWIIDRLRHNDLKVAKKLEDFAKTLNMEKNESSDIK